MKGKGKGMAYSGGKSRVGKKGVTHGHHTIPSQIQTMAEASKKLGLHYGPEGKEGLKSKGGYASC